MHNSANALHFCTHLRLNIVDSSLAFLAFENSHLNVVIYQTRMESNVFQVIYWFKKFLLEKFLLEPSMIKTSSVAPFNLNVIGAEHTVVQQGIVSIEFRFGFHALEQLSSQVVPNFNSSTEIFGPQLGILDYSLQYMLVHQQKIFQIILTRVSLKRFRSVLSFANSVSSGTQQNKPYWGQFVESFLRGQKARPIYVLSTLQLCKV